MRAVTWNVNSLKMRMPRVLELLEQYRPDLVFLQETKSEPDAFPHMELEAAGYQAVHHSAGRWAGVALLAPTGVKIENECAGLEGEPARDEARWIEADVDGVRAVSVYVPNGQAIDAPAFPDKLRFLEAIAERVPELVGDERPVLIGGDFNVCRTDADVYDPKAFVGDTHVTEDERSRFEAVVGTGLVDLFRQLHPDTTAYTWWDYRAGNFHKGLGLRIDYLLATPDLAEKVVRSGIARDYRKGKKPSDHAPLFAQIGEASDGVVTPDAADSKQV
ncbi:MAG: exodeoxyribonuclease III [Thermoleophilaceae bacterium]